MPVDYQDIQRQIREMAGQASLNQQTQSDLLEKALRQLHAYAGHLEELSRRVEWAVEINSRLRCALPAGEALDACFPLPNLPQPGVILAADGSQINPNHHDPVAFGVVNVGVIRIVPDSGQAPREIIRSHLLSIEELDPPEGPIGEEVVALMRDLSERRIMAELVHAEPDTGQVLTLTDGPLELYFEAKDSARYKELLKDYLDALDQLADLNVVTAGYVDRPRNDLVVRMLELTLLANEELDLAGLPDGRRLHPLTDARLFAGLLQPGDRTALFGIQSRGIKGFQGRKALFFFYLNVGFPGSPALARIEVPAWVAENRPAVDRLHAALVAQCRQMGSRPFPYALHRAHEVAVVSLDEKQHLELMIANELRSHGIAVGGPSNKQAHKDNSGVRTRYS